MNLNGHKKPYTIVLKINSTPEEMKQFIVLVNKLVEGFFNYQVQESDV